MNIFVDPAKQAQVDAMTEKFVARITARLRWPEDKARAWVAEHLLMYRSKHREQITKDNIADWRASR